MATVATEHYRAYTPKPFTRAERDSTTILFGGLHWRLERVLQAVLENGGHHAQVLPVATREDLLTGREVADIGQCCPTSFTTGNLVNFLKKEDGPTAVEYAVMLALIVIVCLTAIQAIGTNASTTFQGVADELG